MGFNKMTLLFLLAVLLAIPTYGLSIIAWLVWFLLAARNNAKNRIAGLDHMRATRSIVEPLVGGSWSDFYQALDIPKIYAGACSESHNRQCGQHILNFISHNPDLTQAFMDALKLHRSKESDSLPTAVEAIGFERSLQGGPMHHICYFAIATLTSQNNLPCFDDIDTASMTEKMIQIADDFPGMMNYIS